jgi:hypothetical protein
MRKRWAFWLVLLQVVVTCVFVVREEVAEWDYPPRWRDWVQAEPIPRWMTVLNAWVHGTRAPDPPPFDNLRPRVPIAVFDIAVRVPDSMRSRARCS